MFVNLYNKLIAKKLYKPTSDSKIYDFFICLVLSWLYALCSQIIIPLPFNLVPMSIQPVPLFLAAIVLGWHAVTAYGLYLLQGAMGLPFFSGLQGGLIRLFGPTGGYLFGFGLGMILIAVTRQHMKSAPRLMLVLLTAWVITFACGLVQLSLFVPAHKLLSVGFYPFIIGDFVFKMGIIGITLKSLKRTIQ